MTRVPFFKPGLTDEIAVTATTQQLADIERDWSLDMRLPRKSWYIQAIDDGVMIAPVYNGRFGCRLWHVPTIGM